MSYQVLYRGSLSSCNYACSYCPFAKTSNTRDELKKDQQQLENFTDWITRNSTRAFKILITPWGEALVRGYYRRALTRLSHLPNVERIAIQTNLTGNLREFKSANRQSLAFWATYHPTQTTLQRFFERCTELDELEIRYSVGVVGMRDHFDQIEQLRHQLSDSTYLWVNAYKRDPDYYSESDVKYLQSIDPYFSLNLRYYDSFGKPCAAGDTAFTVDGDGNVRRCHFIVNTIGNIYREDIFNTLKPSNCTNDKCGCHIGYIYRQELDLGSLFGDNIMERIPAQWPAVESQWKSIEFKGSVTATDG